MLAAMLLPRHELTVDHYHKMAEAGILTTFDRVELIEGELIDRAPIGSQHAAMVDYLTGGLDGRLFQQAASAAQRRQSGDTPWSNQDEAVTQIAQGIRQIAIELAGKR